jgi:hypothetical protein
MGDERVKNIATVVQSTLVSLALIIGGLWTLYTFTSLKMESVAEAELQTLKKQLAGTAALNITIEASQVNGLRKESFGIAVKVKITNIGQRQLNVDLEGKPVRILEIGKDEENKYLVQGIYSQLFYAATSDEGWNNVAAIAVQPQSTKTVSTIVDVDRPGSYIVSFSAPVPKELEYEYDAGHGITAKELREKYKDFQDFTYFGGTSFVQIEQPNKKIQPTQ